MPAPGISLRPAGLPDLAAINRVIGAAVQTWKLPERVKRLALPGYRYSDLDLEHLEIVVAEDTRQNIIGIAAWEPADAKDNPPGQKGLLLHAIHVDPAYHRRGIGRRLFRAAEAAVRARHLDGLLVKAQHGASGFFISQGMDRLQTGDPLQRYANRFWKPAEQ